jgi:carboxypeptidase C (cathepsin A)
MVRPLLIAACAAVALVTAMPGAAQPSAAATSQAYVPRKVVTSHVGVFGGRKVNYVATAGETILSDPKGAPAATIFAFSYVEKSATDARPVVFVFNGGPGSSSIWLHMGMLGPRKVDFPDPVRPPTTAPFKIADNPLSLLDIADLVFIDPVGTGYSRLLPGGKAEDFYGVAQDARATSDFIQAWLTQNKRWNSPKFVMGESYGAVRAAVLANTLMGGPFSTGTLSAVSLDGVLILGPSFEPGAGVKGDDRAYLNNLPTMAATAWRHGKIARDGRSPESVAGEARAFVASDYVRALYAGNSLPPAERVRIGERLAELTGLPTKTWLETDLRMSMGEFSAALLKDEGLALGAYDARYTLPLAASGGDPVADDPAMGQYTPGFVAAFNTYAQNELKVEEAGRYQAIVFADINSRWNWGAGPGTLVPHNYGVDLAAAMRRNPSMRVFIGAGYYDLVTTFGAAEYTARHSGLAPERLTLKTYASGHMPYLGDESAALLAADVRAFIHAATPQ